MGAQQDIREGKEVEAKLLAAWSERIKRYERRGDDASTLIRDKAEYEKGIAERDATYDKHMRIMQNVSAGKSPDQVEKATEIRNLQHARQVWGEIAWASEKLNPTPKVGPDEKPTPHHNTTRASAIADRLHDDWHNLKGQTLAEYTAAKAQREAETEAARRGPGMAPSSAGEADSSASIGAAKSAENLRGMPTVARGQSIPERASTVSTLGHVAPTAHFRTPAEIRAFARDSTRPGAEERAQTAENSTERDHRVAVGRDPAKAAAFAEAARRPEQEVAQKSYKMAV
jgi:hypothetical protein